MAYLNETLASTPNHDHEHLPALLSFGAGCAQQCSHTLRSQWEWIALFPEWLRLLLIAAMLYLVRRISCTVWEYIDQKIWITVSFDDEDICYSALCMLLFS